MNYSRIAVRYAKALFDFAEEHNEIDAVYEDMKVIERLCSMTEVKEVITNPVLSQKKRKEVIVALTGNDINKLSLNFIELVFSNGRGDHLAAAARDYLDLTRRHRGIRQITITTAVPLNEKLKADMAEIVAGKSTGKIEYIERIDKSIIGGFVLRVDDTYIDASIKDRLNRFRREFSLTLND